MTENISKVLVGIASHELQHVESLHSCLSQVCQPEDEILISHMKRGDLAREAFANMIMSDDRYKDNDALLLLDGDQRQPFDLLERLRKHNLDMACAHYYKRDSDTVVSMCYKLSEYPYEPFDRPPKYGLHEIATTGFGCVLIKKKVLKAMRANTPEEINIMKTDFDFFHKARKLGYRLWLDASLNSDHAVTVWLDHNTAERLKD